MTRVTSETGSLSIRPLERHPASSKASVSVSRSLFG
jgi:hypothetical protein